MPDGKAKTRPSAWSVGLILGLAIAVCEVAAVGALYRDLPIDGVARFLLVYLTCYAAVLALLGGAAGWLAALLWRRRAAAIALGLAAAWYAVMAYRGYWIARVCSWTDEPGLPLRWVFVGAALPAATAVVVAYLLARSRVGRIRFAPLVIGGLGLVGLVAFVTRPTAALPAVPGSALQAPTRARIDSPIDPASTNLLLISIDTMRADHTSPYGYGRDTSPNLAALAERGVLFEDACPNGVILLRASLRFSPAPTRRPSVCSTTPTSFRIST
jgi:glucan phosphoethanolaminetransferase (alkaline phosphatase superfamily)